LTLAALAAAASVAFTGRRATTAGPADRAGAGLSKRAGASGSRSRSDPAEDLSVQQGQPTVVRRGPVAPPLGDDG
jgi:hypothetical protein